MKSYNARPQDVKTNWWVIDAQDIVLGRLSAKAATLLRGKHKPTYTPHIDCGDHVVVTNAKHVKITGKKASDRKYYWHTGYPGGIKETTATRIFAGEYPERVVQKAIERMMPKGRLGRQQFKKLRVYADDVHPHEAQQPQVIDMGALNEKNKR